MAVLLINTQEKKTELYSQVCQSVCKRNVRLWIQKPIYVLYLYFNKPAQRGVSSMWSTLSTNICRSPTWGWILFLSQSWYKGGIMKEVHVHPAKAHMPVNTTRIPSGSMMDCARRNERIQGYTDQNIPAVRLGPWRSTARHIRRVDPHFRRSLVSQSSTTTAWIPSRLHQCFTLGTDVYGVQPTQLSLQLFHVKQNCTSLKIILINIWRKSPCIPKPEHHTSAQSYNYRPYSPKNNHKPPINSSKSVTNHSCFLTFPPASPS